MDAVRILDRTVRHFRTLSILFPSASSTRHIQFAKKTSGVWGSLSNSRKRTTWSRKLRRRTIPRDCARLASEMAEARHEALVGVARWLGTPIGIRLWAGLWLVARKLFSSTSSPPRRGSTELTWCGRLCTEETRSTGRALCSSPRI